MAAGQGEGFFLPQTAEYGKFVPIYGLPHRFPSNNTAPYAVLTQDAGLSWAQQAALNQVSGVYVVNKFGRNDSIDSTTVPEDIWAGGGLYTGFPSPLLSAQTLTLSALSADDTGNGVGARTIQIEGLDENWDLQTYTITLSGTTPVTTTTRWYRANLATVITAGVSGSNVSEIKAYWTDSPQYVFFVLTPGRGRSHVAAWTVPRNHKALLMELYATIRTNNARMEMDLRQGFVGGSLISRHPFMIRDTTSYRHEYYGGIVFTEKSDMVMRAEYSESNNVSVSGGFSLLVVDNALLVR